MQEHRTHSLDEPGLISLEDLKRAVATPREGAKQERVVGPGVLRVEIEVDGSVYLSFEDSGRRRVTVELAEPQKLGSLRAMLAMAAEQGADSSCTFAGSLEVSP